MQLPLSLIIDTIPYARYNIYGLILQYTGGDHLQHACDTHTRTSLVSWTRREEYVWFRRLVQALQLFQRSYVSHHRSSCLLRLPNWILKWLAYVELTLWEFFRRKSNSPLHFGAFIQLRTTGGGALWSARCFRIKFWFPCSMFPVVVLSIGLHLHTKLVVAYREHRQASAWCLQDMKIEPTGTGSCRFYL